MIHKNKSRDNKVVEFEKEASYYFDKGVLYFKRNNLDKALTFFKKTVETEPENPLYHYNVACLLSKLGCFQEANVIFKHIVERLDKSMVDCYFLMAVNCGMMEDIGGTIEFLKKYLTLMPEGEMVPEAEELLEAVSIDQEMIDGINLFHPEQRVPLVLKEARDNLIQSFNNNQKIQDTMTGILYSGQEEMVNDVINLYGIINNQLAQKALRGFLKNPWVEEKHKYLALLVLKEMGAGEPYDIVLEGQSYRVSLKTFVMDAPDDMQEWKEVLDCALENMKKNGLYNEDFYKDLQALWMDYLNAVFPQGPVIKKLETWAAGLEYTLARYHFLSVTQKQVANRYGVSPASVSQKYKEINQVLQIEEKAYQDVLSILKGCDDRDE